MSTVPTSASFHMNNVGEKAVTARRAVAHGTIYLDRKAFMALRDNRLPKGNVLALAEVAGVMAAKKTSEMIPLCHPLALDQVEVSCTLHEPTNSVTVCCTAQAHAKTGVEMEALQGVSTALLSIYDLTKGVCPALTISDIRLHLKEGGKSGRWVHPELSEDEVAAVDVRPSPSERPKAHSCATALHEMKAAVLTISDRVSRNEAIDGSGPIIESFLKKHGAEIVASRTVPDVVAEIEGFVLHYSHVEPVNLILTTGGTGVGPRDVTPEALQTACDKIVPGVGELIRTRGIENTPLASLSRAFGGIAGSTVVIALPGSPAAVSESLGAIHDVVPHMVSIAQGGAHD